MADNVSFMDEKSGCKAQRYGTYDTQQSGDFIISMDSPTTAVNTNSSDLSVGSIASSSPTNDDEIPFTITQSLEDYPLGYPRLAAFESSEPRFSLYRGFDYLHSRVLLNLQDELRCLEAQLAAEDDMDVKNGQARRVKSRGIDDRQAKKAGVPSRRGELIAAIRDKLVNYDEILVKARELNAFQRPSNRDYRSVRTWFANESPLADEKEELFIKQKEDILTLHIGREWARFDGWIESLVRKIHCRLIHKIFCTPELRAKTNDKDIHYYSSSRIDKLVGCLLTFIIFILLVCPVVAMYELTSIGQRNSTLDAIGVLVVFTLLFSAAMSLLTKSQRHELFAASAAYAAVLVVFISNFNGSEPGSTSPTRPKF